MPERNPGDLPILDDIIVAGDADKAMHDASSKVRALLHDESTKAVDAAAPSASAGVTVPDADAPAGAAGDPQRTAPALTDIDALTEAIAASIMPDLQKLLRTRIRQALRHHLQGASKAE